jgi:RND family efflux transporter MFP subunit
MRDRRLHVFGGIARGAVLAALTLVACSKGDAASGPKARPAPLVVVSKVIVRDVPVEVRAPVELRALEQADVGSKTLGVLDAVFVDRGDKVKRGQLVALVRPSDLPDQLSAARGTLANTQASLALAKTNFDRASKLAPSGVVSQQELANATAAVAQAEAQQAAAHAQVSALAVRLGETRIDSPMDGIVSVRRLDPGAIVGPPGGGAIVTIVQTDKLRVFIPVTERDVAHVKLGLDARVELDAIPGHPFLGKVSKMAPVLDPSTRTLDVEVRLTNPNGELRPGMFGHGAIVTDVHPRAPVVPAAAILLSDEKAFVFVLLGDKVQRRPVELGVDEGTWVEIKDGVREGDEIVTAGADAISDGVTVRVQRDIDPYTGAKLTATPPAVSTAVPPGVPTTTRN